MVTLFTGSLVFSQDTSGIDLNEVIAWYADSYVRISEDVNFEVSLAFSQSPRILRWALGLRNPADPTGAPIVSPSLTIGSNLPPSNFWIMAPSPETSSSDGTYGYHWTISDLPEDGGVLAPEFGVIWDKRLATTDFGYDYVRDVSRVAFSEMTATQTVTIEITPREEFDVLFVFALVNFATPEVEYSLREGTIAPEPTAPLGSGVVWVFDPVKDVTYTFTYEIEIVNHVYPDPIVLIPFNWVDLWVLEQGVAFAEGSSISGPHPYLGTLTFAADGDYSWTLTAGPFHQVTSNSLIFGTQNTQLELLRDRVGFLRDDVKSIEFARELKKPILVLLGTVDRLLETALQALEEGNEKLADSQVLAAIETANALLRFFQRGPSSRIPQPHSDFWKFHIEDRLLERLEFIRLYFIDWRQLKR